MSESDDASSRADVPTASELQRAIASVTGVATAEVTPSEGGRDRLRISLKPGEDPEAVAWSVAATLRERFGIALDPAAITARVVGAGATGDAGDEVPAESPAPPSTWTAGRSPAEAVTTQAPPAAAPPATAPSATAPPAAAPPATAPPATVPPAAASPATTPPATVPASVAPQQPAPELAATARHALAPSPDLTGRGTRAAIRELTAHPDGDALEVAATLGLAGREATGRARGVRTRRGRWRAIAEATLAALDGLAVGRVRGHVDHVTVLTFADLAHVSVSVTLLTERGEETFLGAALVRDDADRAVMRAALDAVNRRVEPWLADAPAEAG